MLYELIKLTISNESQTIHTKTLYRLNIITKDSLLTVISDYRSGFHDFADIVDFVDSKNLSTIPFKTVNESILQSVTLRAQITTLFTGTARELKKKYIEYFV